MQLSVQFSRSVMSDSLRPHGLQPTQLLRPWDFPCKSTGVGCHHHNLTSEVLEGSINALAVWKGDAPGVARGIREGAGGAS